MGCIGWWKIRRSASTMLLSKKLNGRHLHLCPESLFLQPTYDQIRAAWKLRVTAPTNSHPTLIQRPHIPVIHTLPMSFRSQIKPSTPLFKKNISHLRSCSRHGTMSSQVLHRNWDEMVYHIALGLERGCWKMAIRVTNRNYKGCVGDRAVKAYLTSALMLRQSRPSLAVLQSVEGTKSSSSTATVVEGPFLPNFPSHFAVLLLFAAGIYPIYIKFKMTYTWRQAEVLMQNYEPDSHHSFHLSASTSNNLCQHQPSCVKENSVLGIVPACTMTTALAASVATLVFSFDCIWEQ